MLHFDAKLEPLAKIATDANRSEPRRIAALEALANLEAARPMLGQALASPAGMKLRKRAAELLGHQDRLMRDPDFDPGFRQVADFTGTTSILVSSEDVRAMAARNFFGQGARRCVIAPTPEIFGLARMFQTFRELSGGKEELNIFSEREEALRWLFADSTDDK